MDLNEAQKLVDDWISDTDAGYWPPLANLARLTEETGELARELNRQFGSKEATGETTEAIELELGDILFVTVVLANSLDVDLDEALDKVIAKYDAR